MNFLLPPFCFVAIFATIFGNLVRAESLPEDPDGSALIQEAQEAIRKYHDGEPRSGAKLRVVYFHPADRKPLPGYAERLERVLNDVSDFYRDGLKRFGLESEGLPIERKDGRFVLHIVKGKWPASRYRHESGNQTSAEIREALRGTVDLDREHVLVLYGLCRKEPDGRYVFDAPYYGGGSNRNGLCHAADCELLDPELLTEKDKKIVYTEHYYPRIEQTIAKFNSMYLGGIAHELGHGLGLPHDAGSPSEDATGTSLMGSGNLTYRQEIWGGGAPVYLSRASALLLASHPLITGSDRGRRDAVNGRFSELTFSAENGELIIHGMVKGDVPPYAVIAYASPVEKQTDHHSRTFSTMLKDGAFKFVLNNLPSGAYNLRLATLHVNGGTSKRDFRLGTDANGLPDANALNVTWITGQAEDAVMKGRADAEAFVSEEVIAKAPTLEVQRRLRALRSVLHPMPPIELDSVKEESVFLSDAIWSSAKVGWGQVARNYYWFDERIQNGVLLTLRGQFYDKGLYAHSPSRYVFPVNGKWSTLTSTVGLRDGAHRQGSAVFVVLGDGRELFRSSILRVGASEQVKVDISGVKELELQTNGGEGHSHNSWAIWVEPKVSR